MKEATTLKKSIYGVTLSDAVVKAVDERARKLGISRSALINQILAEKLSCVTPEMRMNEIFDSIETIVDGIISAQHQRSASLLTMRTSLEYKYRPTISYKVELDRVPSEFVGTLRVQIRTQSEQLTDLFNSFFLYRIKFERGRFAEMGIEFPECELSSGKFVRRLRKPRSIIIEDDGMAIAEYIKDLDFAIKTFLADPSGFGSVAQELEKKTASTLSTYRL